MLEPPSFSTADPLRPYPARWHGPLLLVCRKCQKKLKRGGDSHPAKSLKKALKRLARQDGNAQPLHVLTTSCMKLCPKDGVTVCPQFQLLEFPPGLHIVRTRADIAALYEESKQAPQQQSAQVLA